MGKCRCRVGSVSDGKLERTGSERVPAFLYRLAIRDASAQNRDAQLAKNHPDYLGPGCPSARYPAGVSRQTSQSGFIGLAIQGSAHPWAMHASIVFLGIS